MQQIQQVSKEIADVAAVAGGFLGIMTDLLPIVASVLSIVWLCIRIYSYFKTGKIK